MRKAYKLRPEYEGTLVGGSVTTGPDSPAMDLLEELTKGEGEIVSGDPMVQSILENTYGAEGLLFDVSEVAEDDTRKKVPRPEEAARVDTSVLAPAPVPADQVAATPLGAMPDAEHGDESDYSQLTVDELKDTLNERELTMPARANKTELIQALEASDREGETSNGS